ncbi:MAG: SGNH/GDSL hydrolase family protein [Neptuniibacter sp.]
MEQILVYSDSLTWGIIPNTRKRLSFDQRWPGVCEIKLRQQGHNTRIIENCLNGRRTTWDDPFKVGRNGSEHLAQAMEINSPLRLVVLMLGTNDFQCTHNNNAWLSAQGMMKLINIIRTAPIEPGMPLPDILVISPPVITHPKGAIANKFENAENRSKGLAKELAKVCSEMSCHFMDAAEVTDASSVDGIHLDTPQHLILGEAVAAKITSLL